MSHARLCVCWVVVGALLAACLIGQAPAAEEVKPIRRYALLVGVKDYDHAKLKSLKYAENDVNEMATLLRKAGYQVVLLTTTSGQRDPNARPTRANIEQQLKNLLRKCKKDDIVLIGLAGHGLQFDKIDDNFFCPQDAVPFSDDESRRTLLSLNGVYKQLDKSSDSVKLLLVDASRASSTPDQEFDADRVSLPVGVAVLFSCSVGERTYEIDRYRHSLFFYHVLEGLRGKAKNDDGKVTWDTLQAYVRTKVTQEAPKLLDGRQQAPNLRAGDMSGEPPVLIDRQVKMVQRAQLSLAFGPLDRNMAERVQLRQQSQAQVLFVIPGGGGDLMGLHRGDVIKRINGREVTTVSETISAIKEMILGDRVEMDVLRDKQTLKMVGRYETPLTSAEEVRRTRELAEKDDAAANYYLGFLYEHGIGVEKNEAEAARWYRKAAIQDHAWAQNNLANLYAHGRGVPKDDAETLKWYRKAADQGYAAAQHHLGELHEQGLGVTKDPEEAIKWYRKAAALGEERAKEALKRLNIEP